MDQEMVKTTIVISRDLWRRTRIRAAHLDEDFRSVVIRALEKFLATPPAPVPHVCMDPGAPHAAEMQKSGRKKGGKS